ESPNRAPERSPERDERHEQHQDDGDGEEEEGHSSSTIFYYVVVHGNVPRRGGWSNEETGQQATGNRQQATGDTETFIAGCRLPVVGFLLSGFAAARMWQRMWLETVRSQRATREGVRL